MNEPNIRLTSLSHGGGCGCKIAPAMLAKMLKGLPQGIVPPQLLVGIETGDDAAVWQIDETRAIVATTDFFMPIVDDPFDFGRIAATNALSDVYAMGGKPIFALAVVGMPVNTLPVETVGRILAGGADVCRAAGIPLAGGHSIDSPEPIYGLVGIGLVDPRHIKRNRGAEPGDLLVLGKPLGVGILSAALKKGVLDAAGYAAMLQATTQLNTVGCALATRSTVHAMTDVTGFGLLGHLLGVCRASGVAATVDFASVPMIPNALAFAKAGLTTGAAGRNWESYGAGVTLPPAAATWQRDLLCDPQTSGGLLVATAPQDADDVVALFRAEGFAAAAIVGRIEPGAPCVTVKMT